MGIFDAKRRGHIERLVARYPDLRAAQMDIAAAYLVMEACYESGGKLLIAGNGGSAADSEHIAGELMKRFRRARPVTEAFAEKLKSVDPVRGAALAKNLERCLVAIPLVGREALSTAYMNDVDGAGVFAPILLLSLAAMLMVAVVSAIERRVITWRNEL